MITDGEKNILFLAGSLNDSKYSVFLQMFKKVLSTNSINFDFLSGTNDIWARDYMPVQVNADKFVQFNYDPDYLEPKKYRHLRTDQEKVLQGMQFPVVKSSLIVDGGNVVNSKDTVVMCEKVFVENPQLSRETVVEQLQELFEVNKIVFLPWDKYDYTGHADGMVKFIDEETVLINCYPKNEMAFGNTIKKRLTAAGFDCVEFPYNLNSNANDEGAIGIYINYLQMKEVVFMPVFGLPEDEEAYNILTRYFPKVVTVPSNDIAKEGGVLNCISWNILSSGKK